MIAQGTEAVITNPGPFVTEDYDKDTCMETFLESKILVIGAGGLGCELLKSLALLGFRHIDVIDLDIIDVSNLNRQFLFREADVGKPKSETAAKAIKERCPDVEINAHFGKIQDMPDEFYLQFRVIIGGLDSIGAREWMSTKLVQFYNDYGFSIPYIDGGTESWKGHVKVINAGVDPCMVCQRVLFPEQQVYQLCTIAAFPRNAEHCIAFAKEVAWPEQRKNDTFDGDNDEHINWLMEKAQEHAAKYGIEGVTFDLTRGVSKNIIPAIASTQSIIASMCATECLKLVTAVAPNIHNNYMHAGDEGVYGSHFFFEKQPDCEVCGRKFIEIPYIEGETVQQLLDRLDKEYGYTKATLRSESTSIYIPIIKQTLQNLDKPISQFVTSDDYITATSEGQENELNFLLKGI